MDPNSQAISHPRRPPAHLSVSLRHVSPPEKQLWNSQVVTEADAKQETCPASPIRQTSDDSNDSSESATLNVKRWFDRSNKCPTVRVENGFGDNDPPYFLKHSSNDTSNSSKDLARQSIAQKLHPAHALIHSATNGSSDDDFRSVIDDLTIENKKLKERLRKYESSHNAHLEKDRLFEVKVHSLSACKKRELEEILRSFATSIDGSSEDFSIRIPTSSGDRTYPITGTNSKHESSSATSNSRPVDSAYASLSTSGPSHTSTSLSKVKRASSQMHATKEQNLQSFLHNIPQGLLPNNSTNMSEKQRKKMVVRRLEQLFTGKKGEIAGEHSQSLQQQEVSHSAARADRALEKQPVSKEGVREAYIAYDEVQIDKCRFGKSIEGATFASIARDPTNSNSESASGSPLPEQRPTRPLDLDPDRAQNASDNVEYIRHLGISTPRLFSEDSADAAADAEGWVYLNLLINMAQLHIINVTPDFVRSAVAEVSKKLQISPDGKKLRWRGGTTGTHLSSDSGSSSIRQRSPRNIDECVEPTRKRRKINTGRFSAAAVDVDPVISTGETSRGSALSAPHHPLQYRPLFHHESPLETTSPDDSSSPLLFDDGGNERNLGSKRRATVRQGGNYNGKRRDTGPIVFYSGAQFFTDLSGDRGSISTPFHIAAVDKDGYSNHTQDALGCSARKMPCPTRTSSGSFLHFRPFKDYSRGPDSLQVGAHRPKTPELIQGDSDFDFASDLNYNSSGASTPLLDLEASGLGGTRPADHFALKVKTCWTKVNKNLHVSVSKTSTGRSSARRVLHSIPKSTLDSFRGLDHQAITDSITSRVGDLSARSSLGPRNIARPQEEPTLRTETISTSFVRLEPSALPEPSSYYTVLSSSEYESDTSSFSGISHLRDEPVEKSPNTLSENDLHVSEEEVLDAQTDRMSVEDRIEEDDSSSIDMLAFAREADPITIAAREEEFERESSDRPVEVGSVCSSIRTRHSSEEVE